MCAYIFMETDVSLMIFNRVAENLNHMEAKSGCIFEQLEFNEI